MTPQIATTVRIENETDYNTLAAQDAESRDLSGVDLPTREEVENGKPTPKATGEKFAIVDESGADWYLRKLASIEAEKARIVANTQKRVDELDTDAKRLQSLFGEQFKTFCQAESTRRRRKTLTFPNGSAAFRTQPRKLIIADHEQAFCHARTVFSHCIKTEIVPETRTVTLDAKAYKAEAERTGELLPGMDAIPEREVFTVNVNGGKEEQRE